MKETRYKLGKLHAQGATTHYKEHYEEFKEQIDAELQPKVKETKSKKEK